MTRRHLSFRQLETFVTVARLGSFSRAAEALHLTQPAVSIQVRQITDSVGLPLFEQSGREIRIADDVLFAAKALARQEKKSLGQVVSELARRAFASPVGAAQPGLPSAPLQVEEELKAYGIAPLPARGAIISNELIDRLRANEDDLYIMSFPPEELDVVATPFLDNPLVVVAPVGYPLPAGVVYYEVPRSMVISLGVPPSGYRYVRVASDILLIAIGTSIVVDALEDLVR